MAATITRRRFLTFCGVAAPLLTLAGCGGSTPATMTTMRVFMPLNAYESAFFERAILPPFQEKHRARVVFAGSSAVEVFDQIRGGNHSFDVVTPDVQRLGELIAAGLVREIGAGREALPPETLRDTVPNLDGSGEVFALPFRPAVWLTFYNQLILEGSGQQPPATWDDLLATAQALHAAGGAGGVALQGAPGPSAAQSLVELIWAFGGDPLEPDGPEALAAGAFLRRLGPYLDPFSREAKFDTMTTALGNNRIATGPNWAVVASDLLQRGGKRTIGVIPGPRGIAGYGRLAGGQVLVVPARAPHAGLALEFAAYLWSRPVQDQLASQLAWLPMRADAFDAAPDWQQPVARAALEALRGARALPPLRSRHEFDAILGDAFRRIAFEGADAEQVLAAAAGQLRAMR